MDNILWNGLDIRCIKKDKNLFFKNYNDNEFDGSKIYDDDIEFYEKLRDTFLLAYGFSLSNPEHSGEKFTSKICSMIFNNKHLTVFDVGANKGTWTTMFLNSLYNNTCTIHCFEPVKNTYSILQDNFKNIDNVICNNYGISNENNKSVVYLDSEYSECNTIYDSDRKTDVELCNFITIEDYAEKNNINKIDVLKLDVEGHELIIIKSIKNYIKNNDIPLIQFEFGSIGNTKFLDFLNFFNSYNYTVFRLSPIGYIRINKYSQFYEYSYGPTNYIAINKSYTDKLYSVRKKI